MFKHILVPVDGSPLAESGLPYAVNIAKAFGSRVTLLEVLEEPHLAGSTQTVDPLDWHMCRIEVESYMGRLSSRLQEAGLQVESVLLEGHPAQRIIEFARGQDVDLIVLSSHGRSGLNGWNAGGVVQKIIMRARISLMIVRSYQPAWEPRGSGRLKVLVPLDGSSRAEYALSTAVSLASFHEAKLLLAHIVSKPDLPRRTPPTAEDLDLVNRLTERNRIEAEKYFEQLQSHMTIPAEVRLLIDEDVPARLHELAKEEKADIVVLSAHGYTGKAAWPYGAITTTFIDYGTTPLLILQDVAPGELDLHEAELATAESKGH